METVYVDERQRLSALRRNQAFWKGGIEEGPLMWVPMNATSKANAER